MAGESAEAEFPRTCQRQIRKAVKVNPTQCAEPLLAALLSDGGPRVGVRNFELFADWSFVSGLPSARGGPVQKVRVKYACLIPPEPGECATKRAAYKTSPPARSRRCQIQQRRG